MNNFLPADLDMEFLLRADLMSFVRFTFDELHADIEFVESPHLRLIAAKLEECAAGKCRRLIICLPPRSLKSIIASVAFPAWLLGNTPNKRIICASYAQDLADKHAMDTRTVMNSSGYKRAFATRLSAQKRAVGEFITTEGGFRMATSVGGVLTGRGGDFLIIDDPLKPQDALSDTLRTAVNHWYDNTLSSRLNDKEHGVIIVIMQRLHQDDLIGHLTEREGWDVLRLPAIAESDELLTAKAWYGPVYFRRGEGEALDRRRESLESLQHMRATMGTYAFEAQYQQNPQPEGGAMIKRNWLCQYSPAETPTYFDSKIQSWDTANKSGELNDYSVCTTWGIRNGRYFLLDVFRKRLEYPELVRAFVEQARKHNPRSIVVEDKASGTQLLQQLRRQNLYLKAYTPPAKSDKVMRLYAQTAVFENGLVFLPTSAPWLEDYVKEITTFPGAKYDDQVDSTTQALDYIRNVPHYASWDQELRL